MLKELKNEATKLVIVSKKVRFNKNAKVRKIMPHHKYTAEEKEANWYSNAEFKQIRTSAVATVTKLAKGIDVDSDENDCSRGLEFKTPQKNKIRQTRKLGIIWQVLGQQEMLQMEGKEVDPERLADVYTSSTIVCVLEAISRAKKDELAARGALERDPRSRKARPLAAPGLNLSSDVYTNGSTNSTTRIALYSTNRWRSDIKDPSASLRPGLLRRGRFG
jgi:hypothetical protein